MGGGGGLRVGGQNKRRKARWDGPSICVSTPWHLLHVPPSGGNSHCSREGSCPVVTASSLGLMWEEGSWEVSHI